MSNLQTFFQSLNSLFDHIYVITLERAIDRHRHIRKELEGLNYELFFGKDKKYFTVESLKQKGVYDEEKAKKQHRYGKAMQEGQVGCAWSHAEVYKDIIQKNYKKVLILEDDIVIDEEAAKNFSSLLGEIPQDWELIYFGFAERETAPAGLFFKKMFYHVARLFGTIKFSHKTISHLYPKKRSRFVYEAGYHDCSHAYAITRSAAEKLSALQQPISFVADNLLAYAVTNEIIKGYIILPRIINQQYQLGISSASYLNN